MSAKWWKSALGLVTGCLALLVLEGCSSMKYHYAVDVINKGKEEIYLDPFQIAESPDMLASMGIMVSGAQHGIGVFTRRPIQHVTLTWQVKRTGEKGQASVALKLPIEFTPKRGFGIYLYLNPDTKVIEVNYDVIDPKTGDHEIIKTEPD